MSMGIFGAIRFYAAERLYEAVNHGLRLIGRVPTSPVELNTVDKKADEASRVQTVAERVLLPQVRPIQPVARLSPLLQAEKKPKPIEKQSLLNHPPISSRPQIEPAIRLQNRPSSPLLSLVVDAQSEELMNKVTTLAGLLSFFDQERFKNFLSTTLWDMETLRARDHVGRSVEGVEDVRHLLEKSKRFLTELNENEPVSWELRSRHAKLKQVYEYHVEVLTAELGRRSR